MSSYYYSNDKGSTWEGPLGDADIAALRMAGVIDENTLLKAEGAAAEAPSPSPAPLPAASGASPAVEPSPVPPVAPASTATSLFFVLREGVPDGPYTQEQLHGLQNDGRLQSTDFVLQQGSSNWVPYSTICPECGTLPSLKGFSLPHFFSDVFKHHTHDEMVDAFCVGSKATTPPLSAIPGGWPTPWIFARLMLFCLLLYFGFNWACVHFENPKLVPGLIFVGNFGFPFCLLVLFYELNVRRDVPFYDGAKAMMLGGLLSLIFTLLISKQMGNYEAYWAGPIEESAKLLAVICIAGSLRNGRILTGMFLGAAVGAGFAAFESAGYTFEYLVPLITFHAFAALLHQAGVDGNVIQEFLKEASHYDPDSVMQLRAILTVIAGHATWTAITAGAFWMVMGQRIKAGIRSASDRSFALDILAEASFLKIALVPVAVHMFWNSDLLTKGDEVYIIKWVICGIATWFFVFKLVAAGIKQVQEEKYAQNG